MTLIKSSRYSRDDFAFWKQLEEADLVHAKGLKTKIAKAKALLSTIWSGYVSVSWGKDSVAVAHLAHGMGFPVVWIRVEPIRNPDCELVRDAFLSKFDCEYHEIERWCEKDKSGWHATGSLESGATEASKRFGRRITGIRMDESSDRRLSAFVHGEETTNTVRPILRWTVADVMGYLALNRLPVHPAYACLGGGLYNREWLRVCSLGGRRGDGNGRTEWERQYYGDVLNRLESMKG
jgi:phosphoadenosine phosphosulfate reductase